ncbi:hypothetical protein Nepgr_018045 [Nepenthes gracilis]|uniref:Methyltransferase n=1 Tax=Nepenthes gracilis TaxID=150966 RepID=A0AAD3SSU6_NEPGR|nr:hypothetical protein Nepgr_018045 [Nepenthes gracilis]
MKEDGSYFSFPDGGSMSPEGVAQSIEKLGRYISMAGGILIAWDLGNVVTSVGGYLLSQNILTLFVALRDSHKAQLHFALERGIPTSIAMPDTRRMPFIALSFDLVHCSRCLLSFTAYNATYIIEVDHLLWPVCHIMISGSLVHWVKLNKEWNDSQAVAKVLCSALCLILWRILQLLWISYSLLYMAVVVNSSQFLASWSREVNRLKQTY